MVTFGILRVEAQTFDNRDKKKRKKSLKILCVYLYFLCGI